MTEAGPKDTTFVNRFDRRDWAKRAKRLDRHKDNSSVKVGRLDELLEREDDLSFLKGELKNYLRLQEHRTIRYRLYQTFHRAGFSEEACQHYFLDERIVGEIKSSEVLREMLSQRPPASYRDKFNLIITLIRASNRVAPTSYDDLEELEIAKAMVEAGFSLDQIFKETLRVRVETIGLLKMQIEWLEAPIKAFKKRAKDAKVQARQIQGVEPQIPADEILIEIAVDTPKEPLPKITADHIPFGLSNWRLFWTTRFWSDNPNHLIAIPVDSRTLALESLGQLTRGQLSIKTSSVLNAVEFHLISKDVIQKALATRHSFGSDESRDWIKIKRGRNRIGLHVAEETHTAIFFAGQRDVVYR